VLFKALDALKHDLLVKIETGKMAAFQIEEDSNQTDKETKQ
jgi:phosphoribosylformylglycinamidine (FGAM) synthase PurS component